MDEKDLFAAWKGEDPKSEALSKELANTEKSIAQQKSNDIFKKIERNIWIEGVLGAIVGVSFPFIFWSYPIFFWLISSIMILAVIAGFFVYRKYLLDLKALNEQSLVHSIKLKINILRRYIRQQKFYFYIFGTIGFFVGAAFALEEGPIDLFRIGFITLFILPFLIIFLWLGNRYIYQMYGKALKKIETIYQDLISEEA